MSDPNQPQIIAGWYPDPENESGDRWWNGTSWSDHRRSREAVAAPSVPAIPAVPINPYAQPVPVQAPYPPAAPYGQQTPYAQQAPYGQQVPYGYVQPAPYSYTPNQYGAAPYSYAPPQPKNSLALASLIVSVCSPIISIFGVTALAGGILGIFALRRASQLAATGVQNTGRGMALAGLIVGFAVFVITVLLMVYIFSA